MCSGCQTEIDTGLNARVEDARQRKTWDDQRRRYDATWRQPRPSKRYCRGSSPAFVRLMTVDSVFSGKYLRTYEAVEGRGNEPIAAQEYGATVLLTR